jgi:hypothetical protein
MLGEFGLEQDAGTDYNAIDLGYYPEAQVCMGSPTCIGFILVDTIGLGSAGFTSDGTIVVPAVDAIGTASTVPEPATYTLLLAGLGLSGLATQRRRSMSVGGAAA